MNKRDGLHTLFLLDLDPINGKFMSIKEAVEYLISNNADENVMAIGCARIGTNDAVIRVDSLKNLVNYEYGGAPYCIVIPGKMHFMEEDALKLWKE